MAEEVSTGGLKSFRRPKGENLRLDEARRAEINAGYQRYYERRALERRNKIIFWIIGLLLALIVFGILGYFALRYR